ncbi:MAG: Beta-galactosidase [Opitutia bacterium UBA7350]|nr:MAG: Beta-galactosidase [Opitutae bacterium UBA7350]
MQIKQTSLKPSIKMTTTKLNIFLLHVMAFLGVILSSKAYTPEFSTAGFFQTDSSVREAINFNPGWRFIKGDAKGAEAVNFDDDKWTLVNLPHGMELLPLAASGGVNYQGPSWYRKKFEVDNSLKGRKVILHFEGIMGKSKIWLNGKLLKENFGGYFPIHLDLSEHLNYNSINTLAVRADNSNDRDFPPGKDQEALDFTYFGGIYRDAWLVTHNDTYITHPLAVDKVAGGGIFVRYENLSEEFARVVVNADIANDGPQKSVSLHLELKDREGNLAARNSIQITLPSLEAKTASLELEVDQPKLWRPDNPHLYDLYVRIEDASGKLLDNFRKRIGLRTIEMRGADGLYLNGKPYPQKLIGANRHQDFAHIGHALPNNLHYRDALKLRQTGMRVIRSAHYIQDPAFMDACDELGLFIVTTIPGWQFWNEKPIFSQRMLQDVRSLIRLERNRPSVLLWEIVPNETHFPEAFAIAATQAADEEYPFPGCYTTTDARTHRTQSQKYFDVLYANDRVEAHPDKNIFKREWGDFVDNWVDHNSVSRVAKQWGETAQIRQALHYFKEEWKDEGQDREWPSMTMVYGSSKSLIGGTHWHPFDHQRGYHPDPFWGGIMDAYRQPKFSYYFMKSLLPTSGLEHVPLVQGEPFVYIAHLMTPFSPEDVVIFTNCEAVKLTLFENEIGVQSAFDSKSPVPRVPVVFKNIFRYVDARNKNKKSYGKNDQEFVDGAQMHAEGLIDGKVVAEHRRWPVGRKRRLVLKVDDSGVQPVADGSDITPVVAYLVDAGGAVKRLSDEYIQFTTSGNGALITAAKTGMNPQKMLWGEAVALVRSGVKAGTIKVRAEVLNTATNGPESAEIEFRTTAPIHSLMFRELPQDEAEAPDVNVRLNERERIRKLLDKLHKTQKELQEYRINEVGRQQDGFIQ